jgi:hypothetical protein
MTNKRIAELREQAFELCKKYDDDCGSDLVKTDEVFQKFAELLLRECVQVGGPEDSYKDDWFDAKADSVAKIKQHFGVEE